MGIQETGTEETRNELAALEQELERARQSAEEHHAALSALDEQRLEREGRLALALRAEKDVERRLEEKREELARAEAEAALEALDAAQESAENASQARLRRGPAEARAAAAELSRNAGAEPDVFAEALSM